ncbi:MAG: hypothetical protein NTW87_36835 [Planctomycetota bacterium]|nr:hypothetical protein [Planctomycetota bacterium]
MNARSSRSHAPGPDLLARYLNAYLHARQMSDLERPWGIGGEGSEALWFHLTEVLAGEPRRLNTIVAEELSATERLRVVETLVPLIFALPLRSYPAELRAIRAGARLNLSMRHLEPRGAARPGAHVGAPLRGRPAADYVGYLPAALTGALTEYLRHVLCWPEGRKTVVVVVSSGGRRRRVRVSLLAHDRGVVVRFLERLPSPLD